MNRGTTTGALIVLLLLSARSSAAPARAEAPPTGPEAPAPVEPPEVAPPGGGAAVETGDLLEARQAFRLGSFLARQGQWVDALAAFERSARLRPHPITTYNRAYCERALGRFARAAVRFAEALEPPPGETASLLPPELAREAALYLEEVRLRVVHVRVSLSPEDATLRVDGRALEPVQFPRGAGRDVPVFVVGELDATAARGPGTFELWLDPGAHALVATGAGEARAVESRTFAAGERAEVRLGLAAAPTEPASRAPGLEAVTPRAAAPAGPSRLPAYIAFGVGGLGLAGGAVFAGLSLAEKSSLDSDPACRDRRCPSSYAERQDRMLLFADLATAGVVAGVVGAAVGTLFLVAEARPRPKVGASVAPFVSTRGAGVIGRF